MNTARQPTDGPYWTRYYRATPQARLPGTAQSLGQRSLYLQDILLLCMRGAWELELRQFMPPASLCETVDALLAMGLIECVEQEQPQPPQRAPMRARGYFTAPSHRGLVPA